MTIEEVPAYDVYDESIPIALIVPTVHPSSQPIEAVPPNDLENYDDKSHLRFRR